MIHPAFPPPKIQYKTLVSDHETTSWLSGSKITFTSTPYPEIQKKEETQSLFFIEWKWLPIHREDESNNTFLFWRSKPILLLFSYPNYPRRASLIALPYLSLSSPPLPCFILLYLLVSFFFFSFPTELVLMVGSVDKQANLSPLNLAYIWTTALEGLPYLTAVQCRRMILF